jgi:hypothetical protein
MARSALYLSVENISSKMSANNTGGRESFVNHFLTVAL